MEKRKRGPRVKQGRDYSGEQRRRGGVLGIMVTQFVDPLDYITRNQGLEQASKTRREIVAKMQNSEEPLRSNTVSLHKGPIKK